MNRIVSGLLVAGGLLLAQPAVSQADTSPSGSPQAVEPHASPASRGVPPHHHRHHAHHGPHGRHAYHGPHGRPPVPHYQRNAPYWRFNGYYPRYEAGFHARHLQDVGFPGGGIWWRGRPW